MADHNVTCPQCGAEYELTKHNIPFRDKDSVDCEVCGKKDIFSWNEAKIWTAKLIEKK
jgi:predicted Zn finger-like uncharacterized protein